MTGWNPLERATAARQDHDWAARWRAWFRRLDSRLGGLPGLVAQTWASYVDARGPNSAAALSYYVAFSLFPLLVVMVVVASLVVDADTAADMVAVLTRSVLPPSAEELVAGYVRQAYTSPSALGIVAAIALLWAASGGFAALVEDVNRAFQDSPRFGIVRFRLVGLAIVALMGLFLILVLLWAFIVTILPVLDGQILDALGISTLLPGWSRSRLMSWLLPILSLAALYRWGPATRPRWPVVLPSAALAGVAWRIALQVFSLFISSGLMRYERLYGTLASVMVLLFWLYVSMVIVLVGAHLCAAMERRRGEGAEGRWEGK